MKQRLMQHYFVNRYQTSDTDTASEVPATPIAQEGDTKEIPVSI